MGQQVGPWTDLYSVGCMAFELFTGRVPFHDIDAPMAILMRHVNEPIPPVRAIDPSIDEEISDWIQGLLSKDPAARMGSAAAAWDAYEEIADRLLPRRWHRVARLTGTGQPATRRQRRGSSRSMISSYASHAAAAEPRAAGSLHSSPRSNPDLLVDRRVDRAHGRDGLVDLPQHDRHRLLVSANGARPVNSSNAMKPTE